MASRQKSTRRHTPRSGSSRLSPEARLHASGSVADEVLADMRRYAGDIDDTALEDQIELGGIVRGYLPGEVPKEKARKPRTAQTKKAVPERIERRPIEISEEQPDWKISEATKALGRLGIAEARAALAQADARAELAEVEKPFIPTSAQLEQAEAAAMLAARAMYVDAIRDGHITAIPEDLR